jgi:hypothetical protein
MKVVSLIEAIKHLLFKPNFDIGILFDSDFSIPILFNKHNFLWFHMPLKWHHIDKCNNNCNFFDVLTSILTRLSSSAPYCVGLYGVYKTSFKEKLLPFWGKTSIIFSYKKFLSHANLPSIVVHHHDGSVETSIIMPLYLMVTMIYFQFCLCYHHAGVANEFCVG